MKKIEKLLSEFAHTYHPEHFYCRIKDMGISKTMARKYAERYEIEIYRPLNKEIKRRNNIK